MQSTSQPKPPLSASPIVEEVTLGPCRLILGDCLKTIPLLGGADAVITDPPYGIDVSLGVTSDGGDGGMWAGVRVLGDHSLEARDEALKLLDGVEAHAIFASHKTEPIPYPTLLVWNKGAHTGAGNLSIPWKPCFEFIWVRGEWTGFRASAVLSFGKRFHPTEKPIDLMAHLTSRSKGLVVLDPFMGSGTTGIACIRTGRQFIGIEKDPAHYRTAVERIRLELQQQTFAF
jgi:hypothetical protein